MKMKLTDYIVEYLSAKGIDTVFTVTGGGSMHLNDSFGHSPKFQCIYNHHEQASAIAAESYARIQNKAAVTCVTSGPGAINALNGVAGGYMDSIPMLILSGQVKSTLTVKNSGLHLRTLGNQEFDIIPAVTCMTKYCEMIENPVRIRYCLEKALYMAHNGRPGPCWLDIPLDIQNAYVETEELEGYLPPKEDTMDNCGQKEIAFILDKIKRAKRPVLYAGNGIRISGGYEVFQQLVDALKIPVVTCWNSIDLMPTEHSLYTGRAGTMGDRAGNFAVQNSDLLLVIGSRLNIYQVGYDVRTWARKAYTIVVDIDEEELKKPTIRVDYPVCADAKRFIQELCRAVIAEKMTETVDANQKWLAQCSQWKNSYPVIQQKHYEETEYTNVYAFVNELSKKLFKGAVTVVANGSASVVGSQTYIIKKEQRFLMNCALSSMGYELPAAIGACVAAGRKEIYCIAGDGSIQMNLQELQTIITNQLPIKIFIINNQGYHQIRLTQSNIFGKSLVGVGPESKDLSFPEFSKLAPAYGYTYIPCLNNTQLNEVIDKVIGAKEAIICEIFASTTQIFEPKSATRRMEDGTLTSPPLEDLAPFLAREELKKNMYIDLIE